MHRIDGSGATPEQRFTEGDPAIPIAATDVTADWLNAVQDELEAVCTAGAIPLAKKDNTQVLQSIRKLLSSAVAPYILQSTATAAATKDTVILRDTNARAKIAAPSVDTDIANKKYVDDTVAAGAFVPIARKLNTTAPLTGGGALSTDLTLKLNADSAATASYVVQRDANGRAKIAAPSVDTDIANKKYVDDTVGAINSNATLTDAAGSATLPATTSSTLAALLQTVRNCLKWLVAKFPVSVADGGTGGTSASAARENLGLVLASASDMRNGTIGRVVTTDIADIVSQSTLGADADISTIRPGTRIWVNVAPRILTLDAPGTVVQGSTYIVSLRKGATLINPNGAIYLRGGVVHTTIEANTAWIAPDNMTLDLVKGVTAWTATVHGMSQRVVAFCRFSADGTLYGNSYNVASVTQTGTGLYTVTFENPINSVSTILASNNAMGQTPSRNASAYIASTTTCSVEVRRNDNDGYINSASSVAVFSLT